MAIISCVFSIPSNSTGCSVKFACKCLVMRPCECDGLDMISLECK